MRSLLVYQPVGFGMVMLNLINISGSGAKVVVAEFNKRGTRTVENEPLSAGEVYNYLAQPMITSQCTRFVYGWAAGVRVYIAFCWSA